jgi:hypothetical protein
LFVRRDEWFHERIESGKSFFVPILSQLSSQLLNLRNHVPENDTGHTWTVHKNNPPCQHRQTPDKRLESQVSYHPANDNSGDLHGEDLVLSQIPRECP